MEKETKNSGDILKEIMELEKLEIEPQKNHTVYTSGGGILSFGCC